MARALSSSAFAFTNLVMMTSSMSTLDSTFTSTAKLVALEFCGFLRLPGDARRKGVRGPLSPEVRHSALGGAAAAATAVVVVVVVGVVVVVVDVVVVDVVVVDVVVATRGTRVCAGE